MGNHVKAHLRKEYKEGTSFFLFFVTSANSKDYDLYDMIRIKKKEFILILSSFKPSDMNFQTILAKILSQKDGLLEAFLS